MKINFTKMSGAGNDFVVVDNRSGIISDRKQFTITVCNRRLGIGADGTLMIEKSNKAAFLMRYFNADGTDAGMCGNGGRCIAKFAHDNGIVTQDRFSFEAFSYVYEAFRIAPTSYELKMKNPFDLKLDQTIAVKNSVLKGNYLNTGTDHSIIFMEDNPELGSLDTADVFNVGRAVRYHDVYQPSGTNVNFVSKVAANRIKIRTYERGVEDETLACGTGSVASALLSAKKFGFDSPINVIVKSGETLEIGFDKISETMFENVRLKGPAESIFEGIVECDNSFNLIRK